MNDDVSDQTEDRNLITKQASADICVLDFRLSLQMICSHPLLILKHYDC